jgi:hypothetical protein
VTAEAFFFQSPGYLTIVMQVEQRDVRIIPMDAVLTVPGQVRQWLGDSRGRWDGNTLIVETTNSTTRPRQPIFLGSTDQFADCRTLHAGRVRIRCTTSTAVSDPKTWIRPWSVDTTMAEGGSVR